MKITTFSQFDLINTLNEIEDYHLMNSYNSESNSTYLEYLNTSVQFNCRLSETSFELCQRRHNFVLFNFDTKKNAFVQAMEINQEITSIHSIVYTSNLKGSFPWPNDKIIPEINTCPVFEGSILKSHFLCI